MNLLQNNVGKTDRIARVILGVLLVGNVFFALKHPIGWVGVILILLGQAVREPSPAARKMRMTRIDEDGQRLGDSKATSGPAVGTAAAISMTGIS
ncbi:MAG: DUF2892 domain-containing protein [Bdellovibrio bacteriovorus]